MNLRDKKLIDKKLKTKSKVTKSLRKESTYFSDNQGNSTDYNTDVC